MFKLLPTVPEACESAPTSERKPEDFSSKKSTIPTAETSTISTTQTKKDLDIKIQFLQSKIRKIEQENTKTLRNFENFKRKQEEIQAIRKEFESFQQTKNYIRAEESSDLEVKKSMVKLAKKTLKQRLVQGKENLIKKNQEIKLKISKESKENEDFIRRRDQYYLKEARLKSNEKVKHTRARSAMNTTKEPKVLENLLAEMKNQQDLIEKLEAAIKEEEILRDQLKRSQVLQSINVNTRPPSRSRSNQKSQKIN